MSEHKFGFRTRALHAGGTPDAATGARAVPIYQTSSFVFDNAKDAANLFALQKYGNIYSRIGNPTVAAFEERIASLEGGIGAVATASGMSAEFITFAALAGHGDHIVASAQLYGGTVTQLDVTLRRFGVDTTFVPSADPAEFRKAIRANTKALYVEVIGNPGGEIADLDGLSAVAHEAGIPLVVDSTLATPYLVRPIEHGADIVMHSATKYISGHSDVVLGALVTRDAEFYASLAHHRSTTGAIAGPFEAWLLLRGMRTLHLRVRAACANALQLASALEQHPAVSQVLYPGLPSHPGHAIAAAQMSGGFGGMLSIRVQAGEDAARQVAARVRVFKRATSLGSVESLIEHRASVEGPASRCPPDLLRLSVGIEPVADLLEDLQQALGV